MPDKKSAKFFNVMAVELKKWFGLTILMGIVKIPRIEDYWATNPFLETPIFDKTMSRYRFWQILSFLHFSDNSKIPANADQLFKYVILVRMLCDSVTGYISRYKMYSGIKKPLKDTVIKLLKNVTGKWNHLYMDSYYNSVELAEDLLTKKIRICGTLRKNIGLPAKLKNCKLI
ncbi:piggyBac transposable element-derived protein 4-like [Vespa crabro]|uniref:piggyBac transposable element-derived protein 4-like n=1 Tax=Vespa crabro TaxID=7445 RepID=UPI001F00D3B3|nr:piggyBac transposable element-derived protein 4-like [Vespa crabro]